jgi:uncharacterized membrane protein YeaQ/YmgE (transglycosylase-associated protein family)
LKEGALGCARWDAPSPGPRAALESPIVRPSEEFGEIGVISRIKDEEGASRMLNVSISFANLVMWILVGGLAGWLASLVVRGGGLGLIGDVLVGVIGAFLGGLVLSQAFPSLYAFTGGFTGFSVGSLIVAFIGAVILLLIARVFTARSSHTTA